MRFEHVKLLFCFMFLCCGCSRSTTTPGGAEPKTPTAAVSKDNQRPATKTGMVTGHVSFNGVRLQNGIVTFHAADSKQASAMINADGSYVANDVPVGMATVTVGNETQKKGDHPTAKTPPAKRDYPKEAKPPAKQTIVLPAIYAEPATSPLRFEIIGMEQQFDIHLKG